MTLTSAAPSLGHDAGPRGPDAMALTEFDVALPASLRRFGETVRASLIGPETAPLLVLLGGISANRHPAIRTDGGPGWWAGLAGAGGAADPAAWRVLGLDFVADETGRYAPSPADQAKVIAAAMSEIGVGRAHAVIGASYGGMIALAFAEAYPELVDRIVVISADASPHPTSTAVRELQRRVVKLGLEEGRGDEALAIARGMAMLTYRCPNEFRKRFDGGIAAEDPLTCSEPGAYLRARGTAFRSIMSPQRFLSLSASIDRQRVDPARITTPTLLIGADNDQLVQRCQMEALADRLAGPKQLHMLHSLYGHDMFLKDVDQMSALIGPFLQP